MAASYKYLGTRGPVTGTPDNTGFNPGNWNVIFTPVILNFTVPEIFIYKLNVKGAVGSSFDVRIESQLHDANIFGNQNSWYDNGDDSLLVRPTETFYLMYNNPVTDHNPPVAWAFLRYDLNKWGISENYG
jgi:hypothetical protein